MCLNGFYSVDTFSDIHYVDKTPFNTKIYLIAKIRTEEAMQM